MWGKIIRSGRIERDFTAVDDRMVNRTKKVFGCLEQICREFDLDMPQWMNGNIAEFGAMGKTRFAPNSFMDSVDFDFLEIQVVEEDV